MTTETTTLDSATAATTIDGFFRAWNADTDDDRLAAVRAAYTDAAVVKDPLADVQGHDAIVAFITGARAQFPGHTFRRSSGIDAHHDLVRFAWQLLDPNGQPVVEGFETGQIAGDGRLSCTLGFFGPLPALDEEVAG
jgi:hypothetical protein